MPEQPVLTEVFLIKELLIITDAPTTALNREQKSDTMIQIMNPFRAAQELRKLKSEKKWIAALIIVFIPGLLSLVGNSLIQQKSQHFMSQYVEETSGFTETELMYWENLQEPLFAIVTVLSAIIIIVAWVFKSAVFHVLSRGLGGEKVGISSTIHLIAYTYLPFIFTGLLDVYRGLTYELPTYEEYVYQLENPDVLGEFVSLNSIFLIWALILMGIAVREQFNLSTMKASLVVLIPYIGYWVIAIALQSSL